jgi:hypothetical protein
MFCEPDPDSAGRVVLQVVPVRLFRKWIDTSSLSNHKVQHQAMVRLFDDLPVEAKPLLARTCGILFSMVQHGVSAEQLAQVSPLLEHLIESADPLQVWGPTLLRPEGDLWNGRRSAIQLMQLVCVAHVSH